MSRPNREAQSRKAKKSFTLTYESVAFLETVRRERHARSTSSVLEDILQKVRDEEKRSAVEKAIADYYSSLSSDELKEQVEWGELALREFPAELP
jgi:uncharacterized protein YeeX (DUF496 family)